MFEVTVCSTPRTDGGIRRVLQFRFIPFKRLLPAQAIPRLNFIFSGKAAIPASEYRREPDVVVGAKVLGDSLAWVVGELVRVFVSSKDITCKKL